MIRFKTVLAGGFAAVGVVLAGSIAAQAPQPVNLLASLRDGQWELRPHGGPVAQRLCIRGGAGLIQLRHPGKVCDRLVLEQTSRLITVQYTCKGSGFGRTQLRRETSQLIQIETQGVAEGLPFEYAAEGRWVGECAKSAP
ncbi:DUF3617 domain-containing protein [Novosphingobium bradum]|uniref:DUF3617 domain-containing protein n=2 Tax=Novosphingobium bradum TaxID=1737444 RepID=A0ABV7IRB6_9SPHN